MAYSRRLFAALNAYLLLSAGLQSLEEKMIFNRRLQRSPALSLLSGLLLVSVLTGCDTASPILANDSRVFQPSIRVTSSLDDDKPGAANPQSGRVVEFGLTKARGSGDQTLPAGKSPILFNNKTFVAPSQLKNDFNLTYADLSFRWRKFFRDRALGIELGGGAGYTSLNLAVSSAAQSTSELYGSYGIQGGFAFIWRLQPSTSLHARVAGYASRGTVGVTDLGRYDFYLAQALGDNLSLRAGYAKWEVNGSGGVGTSDFRMVFSGPVLGLGMDF
jgi:hypothetical protein